MIRQIALRRTEAPEAVADLAADFGELSMLSGAALVRLSKYRRTLASHAVHIVPQALEYILARVSSLEHDYTDMAVQCETARDGASAGQDLESLRREKYRLKSVLRAMQAELGAVLTASEWQSPSYGGSRALEAGIQTGKITATINDYKRDQHLNAERYESQFRSEYIDTPLKIQIHPYAVSSGMAGVSTALAFVLGESTGGPVLMGQGTYFQTKHMAYRMFKNRIVETDDRDTRKFVAAISQLKPTIVICDSLSNSRDMPMPDIQEITKAMTAASEGDVFLILENTCLSVTFQPFKRLVNPLSRLHIIAVESLNKFHQFGMDRTTGGMVYASGRIAGKLFTYRTHMGTNIPDASVSMLPEPDRKALEKRLARHGRNALFIATELEKAAKSTKDSAVAGVAYPGLASHPQHRQEPGGFDGAFLTLAFAEKKATVPVYKKFIAHAVSEAQKRNIPLVTGTSFGLDTTRIYLTALHADETVPFVRIAAGTEDIGTVRELSEIFVSALKRL